jgi:hypothetical protein
MHGRNELFVHSDKTLKKRLKDLDEFSRIILKRT